MKVLVALHGTDRGRSGIGRYTEEILSHWGKEHPDLELTLSGPRSEIEAFAPKLGLPTRVVPDLPPGLDALAMSGFAESWIRPKGFDVAFFPAGNRRLPLRLSIPRVATVHDLAPMWIPQKYGRLRGFYHAQVLPHLYRGLDQILVPAEATRRALIEEVGCDPDRITKVENGVCLEKFRPNPSKSPSPSQVPTILFVSRLEHPGKNHVGLIAGFEKLVEASGFRGDLILAGEDWNGAEEIHRRIQESPLSSRIRTPGRVDEYRLLELYQQASLVVVPSLYEGFGLPVLEAYATGVEVVVSDRGGLPEVAGPERVFPAENPGAMAEVMERALARPRTASELRAKAKDRTWKRAADRSAKVLR